VSDWQSLICHTPTSGSCLTAHRSNRPVHWAGLCQTGPLLDSFHQYPVEQIGSDCWQAIHYVFDNSFHTTSVTYHTIGQLRYTYIDQNLQLHVINNFQFTNISCTTKQHLRHVTCSSRGSALNLIHQKWPGPLAAVCPTADRSRTCSRFFTSSGLPEKRFSIQVPTVTV